MHEGVRRLDDLTVPFGKEVRLAVLGFPINHSISPQLHMAALRELAVKNRKFADWIYHKIEVLPQGLPEALPKLAELGYRGLNLTIPHKVEVLPLLRSIDPKARAIGAVNTLSWEDGEWKGYNTDGFGLAFSVKNSFGCSLREFEVLVLGAGGAARAAIAQCLQDGCSHVTVRNRSVERADSLIQTMGQNGFQQKLSSISSLEPFSPRQSEKRLLVINATSLGLQESDQEPIDLDGLPGTTLVYDMIYNPPVSKLLQKGRSLGMQTANGLGMLVGQASHALEIWTGMDISVKAMEEAAALALDPR